MKAVVMAGGEGSRLRPLTYNRPKPMVPIATRPVMEHILALLRRHGITEIVATLYYRAEQIEAHFGDGSEYGVQLRYTVEETPLGTAGSVKQAEALLGPGDFLIVSGDALTNLDIGQFVAFHRDRGALATLALMRVDQPLEYGVVVTEADGRITNFIEKPGWSEVRSDTINTGIYCLNSRILDLMEPGRNYDWSGDIFPRALAAGEPLYGWMLDGYWCDVGSFQAYRQAQADALSGRAGVELPGVEHAPGIWVGAGARIDPAAIIEGPALIGREARIDAGARIGANTVIGNQCRIGAGAEIASSCLWSRGVVEERAELAGAVVGRNAIIGRQASVGDGAVVGDRVHVHHGAFIAPRVKIWPDKTIQTGAVVRESVVWETSYSSSLFHGPAVEGLANIEITPEFAAKLGTAFAATLGNGVRVITSRDPHPASRMIKRALMSGLASGGAAVLDLRIVPFPVNGYMVRETNAAAGLHVRLHRGDSRQLSIEFVDELGIALTRAAQRKLENTLYREDFRRVDPEEVGQIEALGQASEQYAAAIARSVDVDLLRQRAFRLVVDCAFGSASFLAPQLLGQLGCDAMILNGYADPSRQPRTPEARRRHLERLSQIVASTGADLGVRIGFDGERLHFVDDRGTIIPDTRALAAASLLTFEAVRGATVAVPAVAPRVIEQLAAERGGKVRRTRNDFGSLMQAAAAERLFFAGHIDGRYSAPRFQAAPDALAALAQLLELLARENRSASEILDVVPPFAVEESTVPCGWDRKGSVMRRLLEEASVGAGAIDGVPIERDGAWALIWPDDADPVFHLHVEADTAAAAHALLVEYEARVADLCREA
jgi:mannose-1-phosphate guanylyltransferase/phosphomannomutase